MKISLILKVAFLLICLAGSFWLGGRLNELRDISKDSLSLSRLAQLKLMLHIYHDKHGAFPPTKYQRKAEEPVHSWRVLLAPHASPGLTEHYSNYDFSQEWNSTNNLQALGRVPYARSFRAGGDDDITHFLAIGDDEEWPSRSPLRSLLVTKGKDRFLLVEFQDSDIHWMEPKY